MSSGNGYTLASLFCGAGGLDLGFHKAGFSCLWANDFNQDACDTFAKWSGATVVCGDIGKVDYADIPATDVINGGFPCQGFSAGGPRKLDDSRNSLYRHFVRLVEEKKPKAFVAENVKGLLTIGGSDDVVRAILSDFADKGYDVSLTLVNAADYGVPEDRMRTIIVGVRRDLESRFYMPKPFAEKKTLKDALEGVAEPAPEDICQAAYSSRYMSRNRKRGWDEQSFTIPAMAKQVALWPGSPDMIKVDKDLWKFGDADLPEGKQTTRRLSWQEAAAVQTFPSDMEFCGDLTSKYKQIGNAVPPQLGLVVASRLKDILDGEWSCEEGGDWVVPTYTSWEDDD